MIYKLLLFVGPSAIGKTYVADKLMDQYPGKLEQAKLYTTRKRRPNEKAPDRIFITNKKFNEMIKNNRFAINAEFAGSMYGFTNKSLTPSKKHLLINAWPWLIPQFSTLDRVVMIGMQSPNDNSMLVQRMKKRGDNSETISRRLEMIRKDTEDLKENEFLIEKHGKLFVIKDDSIIPSEIIPWIKNRLGL